ASGRYRTVQPLHSNARGDFILRGRLHHFEEVSAGSLGARVAFEMELYEAKTGTAVWTHFYSSEEPVQGKEVAQVVQALERNVKRGLQEVTTGLEQYCSAHPPKRPGLRNLLEKTIGGRHGIRNEIRIRAGRRDGSARLRSSLLTRRIRNHRNLQPWFPGRSSLYKAPGASFDRGQSCPYAWGVTSRRSLCRHCCEAVWLQFWLSRWWRRRCMARLRQRWVSSCKPKTPRLARA